MAKVRTLDFKVRIHTNHPFGDLTGFLDMLRYEGGNVVDWTHSFEDTFTVTVRVEEHRFKPERWRSFGIVPFDLTGDFAEVVAIAYGLTAVPR